MVSVNDIGLAFEHWTFDVLRPFLLKLGATKHNGNPDFYFDLNNHAVLLECKCCRYRTRQGEDNSKPAYMVLRKSQINALRKLARGLGGENETYIIVGVTFDNYDMVPFVFEFEEGLKHAKRWKDATKRKFIPMGWILRQSTFRAWISKTFGVPAESIVFPEFRSYLR